MSCFAIHLDYFINNRLVLVLQGGYFFIRTMIKNTIIRIVTMYSIAIHPLYESVVRCHGRAICAGFDPPFCQTLNVNKT